MSYLDLAKADEYTDSGARGPVNISVGMVGARTTQTAHDNTEDISVLETGESSKLSGADPKRGL